MSGGDQFILSNPMLLAIFDKSDDLVRIFTGVEELDEYLHKRAPAIDSGKLEKMRLCRVNGTDVQMADLLSGKARLSGATGQEIVLVDGSWYIKGEPHSWAHKIPVVKVIEK